MTQAEFWVEQCYWVEDGKFVRLHPPADQAEVVWSSNDDAGHMGHSFCPDYIYRFTDGSKMLLSYSFAEVSRK